MEVKKANKLSLIAVTEFGSKMWSKLDEESLPGISPLCLVATPVWKEMKGITVCGGINYGFTNDE